MRERVYAGAIFLEAATGASRALVEAVRKLLEAQLGPAIESAQHRMSPEEHFEAIGRVRARLAGDAAIHERVQAVATSVGLDAEASAIDRLRLRANRHEGDLNPQAAAAYTAHRDTWFANPRAQINCWIPLHDVDSDETFVIYPSAFGASVPNDSERFDYDVFRRTVGFQALAGRPTEDVVYPTTNVELTDELRFAARAGDVLVFSGAHLHRPLAHRSGRTRFSVDFRVVHLADHAAGLGAPEVDGRARGSALVDYVRPR